jgi:hypothetical protein
MVKKAKKATEEMVSLKEVAPPAGMGAPVAPPVAVSAAVPAVKPPTVQELIAKDPRMSTRLSTIQGIGLSIERKMEDQKTLITTNKGAILGASQVMVMLNSKLDQLNALSGRGEPVDAELKMLRSLIEEAQDVLVTCKQNVIRAEGVLDGLEKGVQECERLYAFENGRFTRQLTEVIDPDFDDLADRRSR